MASQGPRIYTYKITFEEVPYYYYGVHKEKRFNEEYWGSPKTHKWAWEFYTPQKQILEFFDYSDEGWKEAQKVEMRLIKPIYNTDKWCLNESCGGMASLKICRNAGKIGGRKSGKITKELGLGIFGRTKEQRVEDARNASKRAKELGVGIFGLEKEQLSKNGKKGSKRAKELGVGIFGLTPEQRSENSKKAGKIGGKKGAKRVKELGVGIFALNTEQLSKNGKKGGEKTNSQKWLCLETGFITNPGNLTHYQRAKGIDTSKRIRIS